MFSKIQIPKLSFTSINCSGKKSPKKCSLLKECLENLPSQVEQFLSIDPTLQPNTHQKCSKLTRIFQIHQTARNARPEKFFLRTFFSRDHLLREFFQGNFFLGDFFPGFRIFNISFSLKKTQISTVFIVFSQFKIGCSFFSCSYCRNSVEMKTRVFLVKKLVKKN